MAGRPPVDRGKQGLKRSGMTDDRRPLGRSPDAGRAAGASGGRAASRHGRAVPATASRTRCHERRATVIHAFFGLSDTIIAVRSLIRRAWTTHRWNNRPNRRP